MNKKKNGAEELILAPEEKKNTANFSVEALPELAEAPKKAVRIKEMRHLRGKNSKVFQMSDGNEQAVFYAQPVHIRNKETDDYEEEDFALHLSEDGKNFFNRNGRFAAKFSCKKDDELFSIEKDGHRVTVLAKKKTKRRKAPLVPSLHKRDKGNHRQMDLLLFENAESGVDLEYAVTATGVKENIVVKEKAEVYRYPFILQCENVSVVYNEAQKKISFHDPQSNKEVFFIPAPFMSDAAGLVSFNASYEVKEQENGDVQITIIADNAWMNAEERVFPICIDPQINISASNMSSYSWEDGYMYNNTRHTVGMIGILTSAASTPAVLCDTGCEEDTGSTEPEDTTTENTPSSSMETAASLYFDCWRSGSIATSGDEKWYKFTADVANAHLNGGAGTYTIYTQGTLDTVGFLYNAAGEQIAGNDDSGDLNFGMTAQLNYGETYYVCVQAYGGKIGDFSITVTYVDAVTENLYYTANRMYLSMAMPTLPRNPRIKKAELVLTQYEGQSLDCTCPNIALYSVSEDLTTGVYTPIYDTNLVDYAKLQVGDCGDNEKITYSFDITSLVDQANKDGLGTACFVVKLVDEAATKNNFVTLYGTSDTDFAPQICVTYETNYGVNTSYRTHTHELGRFGQGSTDLQTGNLMFEAEDFAWSGNRMPVTIKHLYNSALYVNSFTSNESIKLNTADFGTMKLGHGWKLNVMQSMVPATFQHEGETYDGYIFMGENNEEIYFKERDTEDAYDSVAGCYARFESVEDSDLIYDPVKKTLIQGDDTYLFDETGKLIEISDAKGNKMTITYTAGQITSVTDGAGREFVFTYTDGALTVITAPDGTTVKYEYTDELLSAVTYPDGKKTVISYSDSKPSAVVLRDADGNAVYKVAYTFSGTCLTKVTEYGVKDGGFVLGVSSSYERSVAARRTIVTSTEPADAAEGETADNVIKTVYTFDDAGDVISEYVYSEDTGNVQTDGNGSGIHPHSGDGGAGVVSNINNLLLDHNFESLTAWEDMPNNLSSTALTDYAYESYAKFGKKVLRMYSSNTACSENGKYQTTPVLPAGAYTFSVYLRVLTKFIGTDAGVYIRVSDLSGNILVQSERLCQKDAEFIRLIAPFELASAQAVKVEILMSGKGTVYADGAQLENNAYANAYNLLTNGNFELASGWTMNGASYNVGNCFNMSRSLRIDGALPETRYAYQDVTVKAYASTRETFTLSGWAKGYGLVNHEREGLPTPIFRLRAVITYSNNSTETQTADFSPCTEEWQFTSVQFAKEKYLAIKNIRIFCDYDYNCGVAYFDDIQLVRDSIETGLSAGDFVVESDVADGEDAVVTTEDTTPTFEEAMDAFGNTLTETTFTDGEFGTIYRSFGFGEDGNDLLRETDARGNTTQYTVDAETSRNEEVVDRCGNKTVYEYGEAGRTTKVTNKDAEGSVKATVSYGYDSFDNMTEIVRGDGMKYVLAYNAYHNLESIGVNGKTEKLISYTYKDGNGRLKAMTYANGDTMKATYNSIGQMIAEKWYDKNDALTAHYKYVYDGQGNIVRSIDFTSHMEYTYTYENGNIVRAAECAITVGDGEIITEKTLLTSILYTYNGEGQLTKKRILRANGDEQVIYYENTEDDSAVVKFTAGGKTVTSHSKNDSFGRKVFDELQLGSGFVSRQFSYHTGKVTDEHEANEKLKSTATTQLVSQIVLSDGRTLSYEYDAEERITKVIDSVDGTTEYTYDALGQLLIETVNGETVNKMQYDSYGNILQKNGNTYSYDEIWKDRLNYYNGVALTYDEQGNPLTYLGHTLTWEKGRQLKSFDNITYTYNANGIRTSKTVAGTKHEFTLDGTKILRETWNDGVLDFLYDNEDSVCGMIYNGVPYFYLKNLQGDIIAITDVSGDVVVRYSYDAWGKCSIEKDTSANGSVASANPFRYRGYYFDDEIGLYYLQSRYYDPNLGRFINGDEVEFVINCDIALYENVFSYCKNNTINETDHTGYWSIKRDTLAFWIDITLPLISGYAKYAYDLIGSGLKWAFKKLGRRGLINTLSGTIPKVIHWAGRFLTVVRTVLWRIGYVSLSYALNCLINYITRILTLLGKKINVADLDTITCLFSTGGLIALFLDYMSDASFNNKIVFPFR